MLQKNGILEIIYLLENHVDHAIIVTPTDGMIFFTFMIIAGLFIPQVEVYAPSGELVPTVARQLS